LLQRGGKLTPPGGGKPPETNAVDIADESRGDDEKKLFHGGTSIPPKGGGESIQRLIGLITTRLRRLSGKKRAAGLGQENIALSRIPEGGEDYVYGRMAWTGEKSPYRPRPKCHKWTQKLWQTPEQNILAVKRKS